MELSETDLITLSNRVEYFEHKYDEQWIHISGVIKIVFTTVIVVMTVVIFACKSVNCERATR